MASLYPYSFLNKIDTKDLDVPLKRYLFKFENQRNEISRLKHHEKDFLFRSLMVLQKASGEYAYDLFHIPEAKEFLFHWIILTHANQVMVFEGRIPGQFGILTKKGINQNKRFFYTYLGVWKNQIEKGEGCYLSIIKPAINRKIQEWTIWAQREQQKQQLLIKKIVFVYATFFLIYYDVKLYFDEKPKPYIIKQVGGFDVVFNVYSFVHILSRHYYPNMNRPINVSLNSDLDSIQIEYLPDEILNLIDESNRQTPITPITEYLPFYIGHEYYILWIKYKRLNETRKDGFEVRSFYKCEEQRDLDKVNLSEQIIIRHPS